MNDAPDTRGRTLTRFERPFLINVVVWGRQYCDYMLDYLLPSLLSPGNLPALAADEIEFVVSSTKADWAYISGTPIMRVLERYARPVFQEIPDYDPAVSAPLHMGHGHRLATEYAYARKAYLCLLTPDLVLSDGTLAEVQRRAFGGSKIVLVAALRFGTEPFLAQLDAYLGCKDALGRGGTNTGKPLPPRELTRMALASLHSETEEYEWDKSYFLSHGPIAPAAVFWRVPRGRGIVLHSMSWAPLVLDYGSLSSHSANSLATGSIDGDYVHENFAAEDAIATIRSSDEAMIVSWGALGVRATGKRPRLGQRIPGFGRALKAAFLRNGFYGPVFNDSKRRLFWHQVAWIVEDDEAAWRHARSRAIDTLKYAIGDHEGMPTAIGHPSGFRLAPGIRLAWSFVVFVNWAHLVNLRSYVEVFFNAVMGDGDSRKRICRRMKSLFTTGRYRHDAERSGGKPK